MSCPGSLDEPPLSDCQVEGDAGYDRDIASEECTDFTVHSPESLRPYQRFVSFETLGLTAEGGLLGLAIHGHPTFWACIIRQSSERVATSLAALIDRHAKSIQFDAALPARPASMNPLALIRRPSNHG